MSFEEKIAHRIKELCHEHRLTVPMLAKRSGISQSTIYHILQANKKSKPRLSSLSKICKGLNISLHDFFDTDAFDR